MNHNEMIELAKLAGIETGEPHSRDGVNNNGMSYYKPSRTEDGFINGDAYLRGLAFERKSMSTGNKLNVQMASNDEIIKLTIVAP